VHRENSVCAKVSPVASLCFNTEMALREREPLYELLDEAPDIPATVHDAVPFPFSNDDSMASFQEAMGRASTREYRRANNRVAVVIGESALVGANLRRITEDTIIMVGNDPNQVRYMADYAFNLQEVGNDQEKWLKSLIPRNEAYKIWHIARLLEQASWLDFKGERSALRDDALFDEVQEMSWQKAFIPWYADITSEKDMEYLGTTLRKYDATVTILNLSNVIPFSVHSEEARSFPTAAGYADVLERLPMAANVPILTASRYGVREDFATVHATGPFYGLDDLRRRGGDSASGPVAIHPDSREGKRRRSLDQTAFEEK
jgi:hypothetical protein